MDSKTCAGVIFPLLITLFSFGQRIDINKGYEKGRMQSDYKVDVWQYFDSTGRLSMEIDYSKAVLNFLRIDTSDFVIFKDGNWVVSKVDIPPRYIGSYVEFYNILNDNVDYPMQARYRDLVGKVYIQFEVDTIGRTGNYKILKDIGGECAYEFSRCLKLIPNYWLVAEKDGKKYKSRFIIACEFGIILDGKRLNERKRRKKKENEGPFVLPLAKELKGVSYIIKKGYNPETKKEFKD